MNRNQTPKAHAPTENGSGLREWLDILLRRKWVALVVFVAVFGLALVRAVRTRPEFQAVATMMMTSPEGIFSRATSFWPRGPNLGNATELLGSRAMAERVAERLPDTLKLHPGMLQGMIAARQKGGTDIVMLVATAGSPDLAVQVVNTYAETYRDYDLEQSRTSVTSTREFIDEQLAVVGARLDSAERALANYKSTHQLTDLGAETQALVGQQSSVEAAYRQAVVDVRAYEAELAHVKERIEQEGEGMADRLEGISSPMVASLRAALNQFEVERSNLLMQGFDENSERVRSLERQIDSTRARLRVESQALISQQGFVDPVGQLSSLFEESMTLDTRLVAARARRSELATTIDQYERSIARLPEAERELAALSRAVEADRQVYKLLSERREEARIQEVGRSSKVQILDLARYAGQTKPDIPSAALFGFALALALAAGAVWVVERLDNSVRDRRQLERRGYKLLGSVPWLGPTGLQRAGGANRVVSHLITHTDAESSGAEAFRMLRSGLTFIGAGRELRTIVVTSAGPSEGKSTVAVNLASVLAQAGSRVLLVDADLRQPRLHGLFGHPGQPGLSELITDRAKLEDAVFPTELAGLACLPSGTQPPSPSDLLANPAAPKVFEQLAGNYDYVVVDTPPVLVGADAVAIARQADLTLMVVRARRTKADAVEHAQDTLLTGGVEPPMYVLNGVDRTDRYGRYYHQYGDRYRKRQQAAAGAARRKA